MLLFYKDGSDATNHIRIPTKEAPHRIQAIDPLEQHASHTFLQYLPESNLESASTFNATIASAAPRYQPLKLYNASTWTYSGPLLSPACSSLPPSFHTWATATTSSPSTLLERLLPFLSFLQTFLSAAGAHHYWLTIRATKHTNEYDTPRWHTDENFFEYDPELDGMGFRQKCKDRYWKLATTLLGPSTLFLKNNTDALETLCQTKIRQRKKMGNHACTAIRCLGCSTYADSVRKSLAASLVSFSTESPEFGEVAFFRIGDEEGAVHSEPICNTDRIFVNVVPGTEEHLRNLMSRWGMGFPRAWCFGVPVGFLPSDERESLNKAVEDAAPGRVEGHVHKRSEIQEVGTGSMSVNMGEEYGSWLEVRGFCSAQVFGHV